MSFAGVFVVAHILISVFFDYGALFDATHGQGWRGPVLDQLLRSAIAVALATPTYFVLMSWYGKFRARRDAAAGRAKK